MKAFLACLSMACTSGLVCAAQDAGSPKMNFLLHCAGCHMQDGTGRPQNGIPSFRNQLGHFLKVEEGRQYIIQVPGTSQSPLSDAETAELMNWLLKTYSPDETPADFPPITAREVFEVRRTPLVDVPGRRAELEMRLHKEHGVVIKDYRKPPTRSERAAADN